MLSTNQTPKHLEAIAALIAPQGRLGVTDELAPFDSRPLVMKSVSLHFELMFTRALFQTADMSSQGKLLNEAAEMIDAGKLKTTLSDVLGKIDAETLREAHRQIETGSARGKLVLEGF